MVLNRRDFLKSIGVGALYLAIPFRKSVTKAYAQQNTLEDIASSEPLNYVVQKYDLNDGTLTTSDIGKSLAKEGEILQYFTRFGNGLKDSLLGLVSGDTDKIYFNNTDSLEKRLDVTDKIKNLVGFEPQNIRVAKWSKDNNIAFVYDNSGQIYGLDLNTLKNLGNLTQVFENALGYKPSNVLSANTTNNAQNNSPYDDVLALEKPNKMWDIHLWEELEKGIYKPFMKDINIKSLFDVPYKNEPIISINVVNDGKPKDSLYAIRKINVPKEWEWKFEGFPPGSEIVGGIKVDPNDENVWYVSGNNGLYVTRDGGWTWEHPLKGKAQNDQGMSLTGQSFYIGMRNLNGRDRLYRSDDQGRSWKTIKEFSDSISAIHVSRHDPNRIYVGAWVDPRIDNTTPDGIWRSLDSGKSWKLHPYDGNNRGLITWDIDEGTNGILYVGTEIADHPGLKEGLYRPPFFRSSDKGETWENISDGLPWHVTSIQTHPYENIVYALTEGSGLYKFNHNNKNWELVDTDFSATGHSLLLDPLNPNRLFMGDVVFYRSGGAYMSTDSGVTFSSIGLENRTIADLALNSTSKKLYATTGYQGGIWSMRIPGK